MTAPVAPTCGSRRAAHAWRDLSTGARVVVAAVLALVVNGPSSIDGTLSGGCVSTSGAVSVRQGAQ